MPRDHCGHGVLLVPEIAAKYQKIAAQYESSTRGDGSFGEYLTKAIMLSIIKISNNA